MANERLEEIREQRLAKRQLLLDARLNPYPAEVRRSYTLAQITEHFEKLQQEGTPVAVLGRISSIRRHGGVVFIDLTDAFVTFQLQLARDHLPSELFARLELLDTGDWLEAEGELIVTARGMPTLSVASWRVVTKSIRPLPAAHFGLKDVEGRLRQREVDLLLNEKVRDVFVMRSRMIHWLREYMSQEGYLEVETPILESLAGGAAARPFATHHNALDIPLYLRIAAELPLKRLLVAGFEKVFELGKRFRNEGVDRQHNPEFTMLESQWAYADYEDLMDFTETLVEQLVRELTGDTNLAWQGTSLSFAKPFKRLRYVDVVSARLGVDILTEKDPAAYLALFEKEGLTAPDVATYPRLVDELYKELVRPQIEQPTLVYDYPIEMAPLAKAHHLDPRIAEKFQLIAAGVELNNCYTELNDPVLQREILERQQGERVAGDVEAHGLDEDYLRALEYGMPPNAGWSLGIDRMVMLLTDSASIRDTILFPTLRPETKENRN